MSNREIIPGMKPTKYIPSQPSKQSQQFSAKIATVKEDPKTFAQSSQQRVNKSDPVHTQTPQRQGQGQMNPPQAGANAHYGGQKSKQGSTAQGAYHHGATAQKRSAEVDQEKDTRQNAKARYEHEERTQKEEKQYGSKYSTSGNLSCHTPAASQSRSSMQKQMDLPQSIRDDDETSDLDVRLQYEGELNDLPDAAFDGLIEPTMSQVKNANRNEDTRGSMNEAQIGSDDEHIEYLQAEQRDYNTERMCQQSEDEGNAEEMERAVVWSSEASTVAEDMPIKGHAKVTHSIKVSRDDLVAEVMKDVVNVQSLVKHILGKLVNLHEML